MVCGRPAPPGRHQPVLCSALSMTPQGSIDGWFRYSDKTVELTEEEHERLLPALRDQVEWVRAHFVHLEKIRREIERLLN